jgi:hypothetical protein
LFVVVGLAVELLSGFDWLAEWLVEWLVEWLCVA